MTQITPSHSLTIGSKTFVLDGAFSTLRNVQEFFKKDILEVLTGVIEMRVDEVAHLIAIGSGHHMTPDAIGQLILDKVGVLNRDYHVIKAHLTAWLHVALTPAPDREKKSADVQAMIQSLSASPGQTTSDSPSAPSDGSPQNSGAPTSGN